MDGTLFFFGGGREKRRRRAGVDKRKERGRSRG